jgi:hypothetical protein
MNERKNQMNTGELAKKGTYAGTGTGLIMFLLVGFFPGSLIGGAAGLWISNLIMGEAAGSSLLPRIITALSMVAGVLASAAIFIVGFSVVGWAIGTAMEAIKKEKASKLDAAHQKASH